MYALENGKELWNELCIILGLDAFVFVHLCLSAPYCLLWTSYFIYNIRFS